MNSEPYVFYVRLNHLRMGDRKRLLEFNDEAKEIAEKTKKEFREASKAYVEKVMDWTKADKAEIVALNATIVGMKAESEADKSKIKDLQSTIRGIKSFCDLVKAESEADKEADKDA